MRSLAVTWYRDSVWRSFEGDEAAEPAPLGALSLCLCEVSSTLSWPPLCETQPASARMNTMKKVISRSK